jgi:hypothetical protein
VVGPIVVIVTRQELYDQVWSVPLSHACKTYGLSNVGLAKLCDQWDIPRPPSGYWSRLKYGHQDRRPTLDPIPEGDPVVLSYHPPSGAESEQEAVRQTSAADSQRAFEKRPENHIAVPDRLTDPHPLVARTETSIRRAKRDESGLARPKGRGCLDVAVSPALIDRALRILDAAVKALHARGYPVSAGGEPPRTTAAVLGETVGFRLYEETRRQEREPTPAERKEDEWRARFPTLYRARKYYERVPDGRLVLQITDGVGSRRNWPDQAGRPVEQFLNSFAVGVVRAAETIQEHRATVERQQREWEEEQRRRREAELRCLEEERRRQEEQARFARLEAQDAAWGKSGQIRDLVAAVRAAAEARGGVPAGSDLERWVAWAEGKAAALDPIPQLLPPLAPTT